jgi:hypothetical protein
MLSHDQIVADLMTLVHPAGQEEGACTVGKIYVPTLGAESWRRLLADEPVPDDVSYQLLHRTASAVIEARRFKTDYAAMIVHSFSPTHRWVNSFARFTQLFGTTAERGC